MPLLQVATNSKTDNVETVIKECTDLVSNVTGKPADFVTVRLDTGCQMAWCGNMSTKCAHAVFKSIGAVNPDNNSKLSEGLADILNKHFGVDSGNYYMEFVDMPPDNVGFRGKIFSRL
eukprot:gb/GECG01015173.1/.p1 GENE.gb/GECG01015173.1/~~gb/GECG01015173.1/.p1  ORF type:complete len:118 (+),score=13.73 gb/GECG01015173.1/:1-354(+)